LDSGAVVEAKALTPRKLSNETPHWVLLAHILRPRGNKGEVAAELLTDFTARLLKLPEVFVGHADQALAATGASRSVPRRIAIKSCWLSQNHPGQAVFHFEGVNSINDAEKFRGLDILLPFEQRMVLPTGQYFVADLIGCSVFERSAPIGIIASSPCSLADVPALLGTVRDVQFPGEGISGTPLLEVETPHGELLIPFAQDICTGINPSARRIDVILPEGLSDLNEGG
jgi:16S rRNA processing protein RimM